MATTLTVVRVAATPVCIFIALKETVFVGIVQFFLGPRSKEVCTCKPSVFRLALGFQLGQDFLDIGVHHLSSTLESLELQVLPWVESAVGDAFLHGAGLGLGNVARTMATRPRCRWWPA